MYDTPLIILAGPTATGKSSTSIALCRLLGGSVISADSMQVYHDMQIGSARITEEEMGGIPHYLVDLIDPAEEWNVVRFQQEAVKAIQEIRQSGRLPFVVGGTGFYIQALLYDIDFTETPQDETYRKQLEELAQQEPETLRQMLQEADPEAAQEIGPYNLKRIIRALEYHHLSGEKISEHNRREHEKESAYDAMYFVLTMDRALLYRRIDARVDQMIRDGLVEEVRALKERGLKADDPSMQGLGYRQLFPYLEGSCSLEEAVNRIKQETRHFAKRQLTWFRREEKRSTIHWIYVDQYESSEAMIQDLHRRICEHYQIELK
ncbi:MAG: tRNA (adenosine(37)-N6)-dimethylallyltransferase MiaA [Lachnospiraceae bacterium]|nr:tRNA (adenosine(37)-N6)-dimethylallyltransferase MiaA [Lachnospiraceae bacterium]